MAGKSKKVEKIRLVSQGLTEKDKSTGFSYTTTKNRVNSPEKFEFRKFDPRAFVNGKKGGHVMFKEAKIKK